MNLGEVFRYEVGYQLRRRSTWLYFAVVAAITFQVATESFLGGAREGGYVFNSPFVTAAVSVIGTMFGLLVIAAVAGDAATRDVHTRMAPLLFTTPLTRTAWLGGRFLGATAVTAMLLAAIPLGLFLATQLPGLEPEVIGPFRAAAYLGPYASFTLPNAFIATALLFSVAALSRRALASYVVGAILFLLPLFSNEFVAKLKGRWDLAQNIEPFGFTVMSALSRAWTPLEKNALLIPLEGSLLTNRLLWMGIALCVLGFTWWRTRLAHYIAPGWKLFRFRRASTTSTADGAAIARSAPISVPEDRRKFHFATRIHQTLLIAKRSFRFIVTSWGALALLFMVSFMLVASVELIEHLGVPLHPTTGQVVARLASTGDLTGFIGVFLIVFYAGELLWRDRDAGASEITDTSPVPDWVLLVGKFLGLTLMLLLFQAVMMAGGMLTQFRLGYHDFDIPLYLQLLFGIQLLDYLLLAVLAFFVHVIVNQKYVGHMIVILAFAFTQFAGSVGVEHNLLVYGSDPGWKYSDMTGFGPTLEPLLWFKAFWMSWALLFAVLSKLLWVRGTETSPKARIRLARRRFTPAAKVCTGAVLALILSIGSFVYYNTNILNPWYTSQEREERLAEYERRYGRFEGVPQPQPTGVALRVELYPGRGDAVIHGTYRLENRTATAVPAIHLSTSRAMETDEIRFDRGFRVEHVDSDLGHHIYALDDPLQPGDTLQLSFRVRAESKGFVARGNNSVVGRHGTYLQSHLLPAVGYDEDRELSNAGDRKRHGLPTRPEIRLLEDQAGRHEVSGRELVAFEAVIGTAGDEIAFAPGRLRRSWSGNGRRYFHYAADAPIRNGYAIHSGAYEVKRSRWNDVGIEVAHHASHPWNVDRMIGAVRTSLAYFTEQFAPYPHAQIRMVEAPGAGVGLQAHPINIRYYEGFSLLHPEADAREIDFVFAVTAHEVAHQWWGGMLAPAPVEGAALLSESLAWYSALGALEAEYGSDHVERFMDVMREIHLSPRARADVPLMRAASWYLGYRKGPFAMFALREYVGEQSVSLALRRLLEANAGGQPPLPTATDLYAELRAVTPAHFHELLADLFERNTYWELSARSATAERIAEGLWRVTLDVSARKVTVDTDGKETERAMDDLVEIGVFAAGPDGERGRPLHLGRHRIRSGQDRVTLTVAGEPARAGIDPRNLLIDTEWRDNSTEVERIVGSRTGG